MEASIKPSGWTVLAFLAGVLVGIGICNADDVALAKEHRSQFPANDQGYHYYITTATVPDDDREGVIKSLAFMVASTSRQPLVEYCTPQRVGKTL